jgi:arylsulfatase A-like enzyme
VKTAVSLRDLPATVVDLLGLSAGSPFPGRSLTAHWGSAGSSRVPPEMTTVAFSEMADWTVFEPNPPRGLGFGGFEMSLAADGQHYTRNGLDAERLFDLTDDPFELDNLMQRPDAAKRAEAFRKRLLSFLTENPASAEVEKAYLKGYRDRLRAAVRGLDATIATSK